MTETTHGVVVPEAFLAELVARSSDLGELKAALQVTRLSSLVRGAVPISALLRPEVARSVVGAGSAEPGEDRLRRALDRGVADGILLALTVGNEGKTQPHYLPATYQNRDLADRIAVGDLEAVRALDLESAEYVAVHRPNIFALYERYIGPLTPLVAEQLRDAERSYPRAWIEEAIDTAVRYNKRNWRYVNAILRRWEETGGQG